MSPILRAVGAPSAVHSDLAQISLKVGGNGGALDPYIRCRVTPGDFNIQMGDTEIVRNGADRDRIKVSFVVQRGSRLGHASLGLRWNGPEQSLSAFAPCLVQD